MGPSGRRRVAGDAESLWDLVAGRDGRGAYGTDARSNYKLKNTWPTSQSITAMTQRSHPYAGKGKGKGMPEEVEAEVGQFLTLTPGVAATDANVKKLVAWLQKVYSWAHGHGNCTMVIRTSGKKKFEFYIKTARPDVVLAEETHTDEDFLKGLVFLKEAFALYKAKGTCGCKKNLPAIGQDCEACVLHKSIDPNWTPPTFGGRCQKMIRWNNGAETRCHCRCFTPCSSGTYKPCTECDHTREEHEEWRDEE